jgi:uncharacterized membrane protein
MGNVNHGNFIALQNLLLNLIIFGIKRSNLDQPAGHERVLDILKELYGAGRRDFEEYKIKYQNII